MLHQKPLQGDPVFSFGIAHPYSCFFVVFKLFLIHVIFMIGYSMVKHICETFVIEVLSSMHVTSISIFKIRVFLCQKVMLEIMQLLIIAMIDAVASSRPVFL